VLVSVRVDRTCCAKCAHKKGAKYTSGSNFGAYNIFCGFIVSLSCFEMQLGRHDMSK
jgi:hypothetical protein